MFCCLQIEEDQFGEYAAGIVREAKERGAPVEPLVKAFRSGAGGGRGREKEYISKNGAVG